MGLVVLDLQIQDQRVAHEHHSGHHEEKLLLVERKKLRSLLAFPQHQI